MKTLLLMSLMAVAAVTITGCADTEPRHTTVTTTEETHVQRPAVQSSTTVERSNTVY